MSKEENTKQGAGRARSITLLILDESGSMSSIAPTVVTTQQRIVQQILDEQRSMPDLQQLVSVWTFEGNHIRERIPLSEASAQMLSLEYQPLGNTPLYDAIGTAVGRVEAYLRGVETPSEIRVSVAVLTDGYENASRSFTREEIKCLVSRLRESGWEFSYYGADHDVESVAMELNFSDHLHIAKNVDGLNNFTEHYSVKEAQSKMDFMNKMFPNRDA